MTLFAVASALAAAGMITERRLFTGAAIAVLAVGLALTFVRR